VAEETAAKEAHQIAYSSAQRNYEDLEGAAVATCQGLEGEGTSSSSLASRLRSLGDRLTERLKGDLCLGIQKALGIVSMHYIVNFEQLATGYIIPDGDDDAKVDAMVQADAVAEGAVSALSKLFEGDLLPNADDNADDATEGPRDGEGDL